MTTQVEHAHAKINLVLRILSREASGYHGIETLFQRLELHDVVTVRVGVSNRTLACEGPAMPHDGLGPVEQNLAWRAATLYAQESRWDTGWDIAIDKHIPVGGGLGGGSSDAAAVLRALNTLNPAPLGMSRLLELGGSLGADVPFLVTGASRAWAWGRGDRLILLAALPRVPVTLFTFPAGVNTGAAYAAFAARREASDEPVVARLYTVGSFSDWKQVAEIATNDFERVVPSMHQGVAEVLPAIQRMSASVCARGATCIAQLSGSGATCYVLMASDAIPLPDFPAHWHVLTTHTG